jgi:hypothetical protein
MGDLKKDIGAFQQGIVKSILSGFGEPNSIEKGIPIGTVNKWGKTKMADGSWQYVKKPADAGYKKKQEKEQGKLKEKEGSRLGLDAEETKLYNDTLNIPDSTLLNWAGYDSKRAFEDSADAPYSRKLLIQTNYEDIKSLAETMGLSRGGSEKPTPAPKVDKVTQAVKGMADDWNIPEDQIENVANYIRENTDGEPTGDNVAEALTELGIDVREDDEKEESLEDNIGMSVAANVDGDPYKEGTITDVTDDGKLEVTFKDGSVHEFEPSDLGIEGATKVEKPTVPQFNPSDINTYPSEKQKNIISQYEVIRQSGLTNMYDRTAVGMIAKKAKLTDLADYMDKGGHKAYVELLKNYSNLMEKHNVQIKWNPPSK